MFPLKGDVFFYKLVLLYFYKSYFLVLNYNSNGATFYLFILIGPPQPETVQYITEIHPIQNYLFILLNTK